MAGLRPSGPGPAAAPGDEARGGGAAHHRRRRAAAKFGLTDDEADEALAATAARRRPGALADPAAALPGARASTPSAPRTCVEAAVLVAGLRRPGATRGGAGSRRTGSTFELLDSGRWPGHPVRAMASRRAGRGGPGRGPRRRAGDLGRPADPARGCRVLLRAGPLAARDPPGPTSARVVRTKVRARPHHVAITDGGIHHLAAAASSWASTSASCRPGPRPPPAAVELPASMSSGPLCTGLDVLAAGVSLPAPRAGDVLRRPRRRRLRLQRVDAASSSRTPSRPRWSWTAPRSSSRGSGSNPPEAAGRGTGVRAACHRRRLVTARGLSGSSSLRLGDLDLAHP